MSGTIAVDFDGTLCTYHGFDSAATVGSPVPSMIARVKKWLSEGRKVIIFTARAQVPECIPYVEKWCLEHLGQVLPVTNVKTLDIVEIWDDRAISVRFNEGSFLDANEGERQIPY